MVTARSGRPFFLLDNLDPIRQDNPDAVIFIGEKRFEEKIEVLLFDAI